MEVVMEQQALTIAEASKAGGPKRAKLYDDIRNGRLRAVKFGRSTRILMTDFQKYLATAPAIAPQLETEPADYGRRHGRNRYRRKS